MRFLIKSSSTVWSLAQTRDLLYLNRKFVVIRDFFCSLDVTLGVEDNLLLETNINDLGVTVGSTAVIYESS